MDVTCTGSSWKMSMFSSQTLLFFILLWAVRAAVTSWAGSRPIRCDVKQSFLIIESSQRCLSMGPSCVSVFMHNFAVSWVVASFVLYCFKSIDEGSRLNQELTISFSASTSMTLDCESIWKECQARGVIVQVGQRGFIWYVVAELYQIGLYICFISFYHLSINKGILLIDNKGMHASEQLCTHIHTRVLKKYIGCFSHFFSASLSEQTSVSPQQHAKL